jgi:hypothetical protein
LAVGHLIYGVGGERSLLFVLPIQQKCFKQHTSKILSNPKEREAHASVSNSFFKVHETFYISVFFMALGVKQKWTDVRVIVLGVGDNMPFPVL